MSTNYKLIKYFWIFLFVIKQLIIKIKCDCEDCTGTNCRQVFTGETHTCMSCTDVNDNNDYYEYSEENCHKVDASSITLDKCLIDNTKQIVDTCNDPYLYKIGSICYKNKPKIVLQNINISHISIIININVPRIQMIVMKKIYMKKK